MRQAVVAWCLVRWNPAVYLEGRLLLLGWCLLQGLLLFMYRVLVVISCVARNKGAQTRLVESNRWICHNMPYMQQPSQGITSDAYHAKGLRRREILKNSKLKHTWHSVANMRMMSADSLLTIVIVFLSNRIGT